MVADIDPTARMREGADRGVTPALYRPLRVLDLIPTGTTDGNLVPYTQESVVTGADAAVEAAEGAAKPEASVTFTDEDAPVRTIAAWMKIRKQALADFAALRSIIDTRLRYYVRRRLEGQVLAGSGSGVNLQGILNTPGIGSVSYNAAVPVSELVLSGITNIFLAEGEADGVVLNPIDWQTVLTEKAHNRPAGTVGSYEYVGGGPFASTPQSIWGPLHPVGVARSGGGPRGRLPARHDAADARRGERPAVRLGPGRLHPKPGHDAGPAPGRAAGVAPAGVPGVGAGVARAATCRGAGGARITRQGAAPSAAGPR